MRIKHILFFFLLFIVLSAFSNRIILKSNNIDNFRSITENTDTLLDATYCIDNNAYTEFYFNRDNAGTTYQWQSNNGSGFVNLVNNANFSGVNTNTLGISYIDASYDGLLVRCLATIATITDTSNKAVLYVVDAFYKELTDSMCLGDTYNWHDSDYVSSGIYYDSLVSLGGCDSIYKLILSTYASTIHDSILVCEGDSAFLQNAWQTTAGTYIDTVVYAGVCDTLVQTELFIEYKSKFKHTSICNGDSIFLGGAWQTTSGMYLDTYTSPNGCEINLRTHVSIKSAKDSTQYKTICDGESYYFNGQNYSTAGSYPFTLPGQNGCDSTITLELSVIILPSINATATPSEIEDGETSQLFIEDEGTITWTSTDTSMSCFECNNPVVSPTESSVYYVTVQIGYCTVNDSVSVTIKEPEFDVDIPEGFSPNKDGINDAFEIKYLDQFPLNEIKILNRWGHKVFEGRPYVNNWRGTNYYGMAIGEDLPEGTYYYILQLHDDKNQVFKGYIYIKR